MGEHGGVESARVHRRRRRCRGRGQRALARRGGRPAAHRSARSARRACSRSASRPATRLPDSVILWTRLVPDPVASGGLPSRARFPCGGRSSPAEDFGEIVASGDAVADPAFAHSVHVDATGLEPDTWYWYRFTRRRRASSPVGRTRTAPAARRRRRAAALRLRVVPELPERPLHRRTSTSPARTLDLVLFLGDYIYEDGPVTGGGRPHVRAPRRRPDLDGYRRRYGEYKADPLLQARARPLPVADHVGRPRGAEQLRRRRARRRRSGGDARDARPARRRVPGVLRAHAASPRAAGRWRAHDLPRRSRGATWPRSTCSTDGSTAPTSRADRPLDIGPTCAEVDDPEQHDARRRAGGVAGRASRGECHDVERVGPAARWSLAR